MATRMYFGDYSVRNNRSLYLDYANDIDQANWTSSNMNMQTYHQRASLNMNTLTEQCHQYSNNYEYSHQNMYSPDKSPSMPVYNEVPQQHTNNHQFMANHLNESTPVPANRVLNTLDNVAATVDENDSPVLRALLNNKTSKRLSPNYRHSPIAKRQKTQIENGAISPIRTEDSLDFFDDFTFEKQQPINAKSGFEYAPTMTSEHLTAASSFQLAPITNYVNGISTPPQSPKRDPVNQTSNNCDASSDNGSWTQNGNDFTFKEKRSRQTYSSVQTLELEKAFTSNNYLTRGRRIILSQILNLSDRQVKIWFQNRRMKDRKFGSIIPNNHPGSAQMQHPFPHVKNKHYHQYQLTQNYRKPQPPEFNY